MIRHEEFENICNAVRAGRDKHVKHIVTHQTGKVVGCRPGDDFFEVEVPTGEHKTWSKDNVREED